MARHPYNPRRDSSRDSSPIDRALACVPGWIYLLSGLALLALAMLTPAWTELQQLAWQRDLMRQQAEQLTAQASHYEQFHEALIDNDPILLEHLAYTQLRLKPAGTQLVDLPLADTAGQGEMALVRQLHLRGQGGIVATVRGDVAGNIPGGPGFPGGTSLLYPMTRDGAVDATLARSLPRVGVDVQPMQPINSRLTRLTQGRSRLGLIAVGLALIVGGAWVGAKRA